MDVVMDGLLIAGTLFAGVYCWVLAGRVKALKSLDSGLGGAIVTLTRQIELARATLDEARAGSRETRQDLSQLIARSDAAAAQLRLLLAALERSDAQAALIADAAAAPAGAQDQARAPASAAVQPPAVSVRVAGRREAPGPRLVPPPAPDGADTDADASAPVHGRDDAAATLPKPRRTLTLDSLLRRRVVPEPAPDPGSEAELIAALTALAASGDR